ncbi:RNA polymerase sigma factor [Corallococcus terminator]
MGRSERGSTSDGGELGPETSDERLMLAFQAGDARAFEALVRRHRTPVFNFILRFVGQRARAEDVLQETWLKVVRSAGEYQAKARFTTWVYTIARNLCVDSARKESYRQAASLESPVSGVDGEEGRTLSEALPDSGASPERGAYNARLRPLLERALASLPEEQREVFILREYSGIPFKDIADVTGVSENTVKSRMRYALDGLRRRLAELGVDGDLAEDGRTVVG